MNFIYYDLYYTAVKKRDENEVLSDKYENNEINCISFDDNITPNQYVGIKIDNVMLK